VDASGIGTLPSSTWRGPDQSDLSEGDNGVAVNLSNSKNVTFRLNRVVASHTSANGSRSAVMIAADAPGGSARTPGAINDVVTDNNFGISGAWDGGKGIFFIRANGGFFQSPTIDSNRYYVPAGETRWKEFTSSGTSARSFAGWQASHEITGYGTFSFDVNGSAGLGGAVPVPSAAVAHVPKYAGVV
jgi:hypothetical protein